jgi:hypothetical protein
VGELWEKLQGRRVVRSVYGWIPLSADPVEETLQLWLKPALIARALPGVTAVELVESSGPCAVFTLRVEREVLRRSRTFDVRLQRCAARVGDALRWVATSQRIEHPVTGEPVRLPSAFVEAIELRQFPPYGWLLGVRRVELGRRLGPVFSGIHHSELRADLARALRHAAPVLAGEEGGMPESTSRIE